MSKRYFGTDGIRGTVNQNKINGDMFFKFGLAAGTYFRNLKKKTNCNYCKRYKIIWLYFRTSNCIWISFSWNACLYTRSITNKWISNVNKKNECKFRNYDYCITQSFYDNGLKLFGPDGLKFSDKIEKK